MDLEYGQSVYKGIKDAFPDASIAPPPNRGIYQVCGPPNQSICFISIKYGVQDSERVIFGTRHGELVNLKLNCRENLVMSTSPVPLQLRPLTTDGDVGDVALVKFDTSQCNLRNPSYQAVCEGLILSKCIIGCFVFSCYHQ